VPLMLHVRSLGGRPSYSFITESTLKNVSHMTKIASDIFKRTKTSGNIYKFKVQEYKLYIFNMVFTWLYS
jgi:hypothetical protein